MTPTSGLISDADLQKVRDASRIEVVIGDYVALKSASAGNLKGLCPFHDEKTPSFSVSAPRGLFHCFGCGEGGDVFTFLMKIDQLTFVEAVQKLADQLGITLTRSARQTAASPRGPRRSQLTAITKAAAAFYSEQLGSNEAAVARSYLADRGFDDAAAKKFGCGFAPAGWDTLLRHLIAAGFSPDEAIAAGVAKRGSRGPIDAFHRRLVWAIRDASGDVVGFGARRLFDDDRIEAKYVNTSSDTRLYKKSQVLYGLDLAKRDIVRQRQVVVVEGYTDVMAMHAAGITTAVAACGTAFGQEHIEVLRRYLMDSQLLRGEVIYVFDGDAAGKKAALKAFDSDQRFSAHTAVAVAPDNMDPCELRQHSGDGALRDLLRQRQPLFQFAITTTLRDFNLDTVEGRTGALTATAPMVARIKDGTARSGYVQLLANHIGVNPAEVSGQVRKALRTPTHPPQHRSGQGPAGRDTRYGADVSAAVVPDQQPGVSPPDRRDPTAQVERETLKLVLQCPDLVSKAYSMVTATSFRQQAYRLLHEAVLAAGGPPAGASGDSSAWTTAVATQLPAGPLRSLVTALAVEPLRYNDSEIAPHYAGAIIARMAERHAAQQEADLVSALQRAEATGDRDRAMQLHGDLQLMTEHRRALSDRARGQGQS